jgi:predicted AlkP superfamily phosphohydrolase/phosphomutase
VPFIPRFKSLGFSGGHIKKCENLLSSLLARSDQRKDVRAMREKDESTSSKLSQRIEWKRSKAYYTSDYGIRLNLRGREPSGIVEPGTEEEKIKKALKDTLSRLTFSNGQPVFEAVLFKEEAYSGDYVSRAPDLVVPTNHVLAPPEFEKWDFTLTPPALNGTHSPLGIFISAGKGIKKGKHLEEVQIVDLTPTLLHIFGIPVSEFMDGRILKELFL